MADPFDLKRTVTVGVTAAVIIIALATLYLWLTTDRGPAPLSPDLTKGKTVNPGSAKALARRFRDAGYTIDAVTNDGQPVPAIWVTRLPPDLAQIKDTDLRKSIFIRAILPLALITNQTLKAQRRALRQMKKRASSLTKDEKKWLAKLAARHKLKTSDPGTLLRRVARLPVALMLAQAAVESGWGTSRFAREGNALFGQWTWEPGAGIKPKDRKQGMTHAIKKYDRLIDSFWDYAGNLNTHNAYREFRAARNQRLTTGQPLTALPLIPTLESYSERGTAYLDLLEGIIKQNGLAAFNRARLAAPYND